MYNLICIYVSHYLEQFSVIAQKLSDNLPPLLSISVVQTLLDHIGSLLTLRISLDPPADMVEYLDFVVRIPMFEYVLNGLVAVLVLGEPFEFRQNGLDDRLDQAMVALLKHALDDPAALRVLREHEAVPLERFNDVVHDGFFLAHGLDDLLDDVVAVLVLDQFADAVFQFRGHQAALLWFGNLDCLLHHAAALHVFGIFVHVPD